MRFPGFCGPSYTTRKGAAAGGRTINFYPEAVPVEGAKNRYVLHPTPGIDTVETTGHTYGRGSRYVPSQNRLFTVLDDALIAVFPNLTTVNVGTLSATSSTPVTWALGDASDELLIASAGNLEQYDLATNTLTPVLSGVEMTDWLDGWFLALMSDSSLRISGRLDGTTWSASQSARRTRGGDPLKAMVVQGSDIYLLGTETGEAWYNAGSSPYPFEPRPGAFFEAGITAPYTLAPFDNTIVWLGARKYGQAIVYRADGYVPVRISDHGLEAAIAGYATIDDAIGYPYEAFGHSFYVLTFPSAGATWVYDAATRQWHERGFWSTGAGFYGVWKPAWVTLAFGDSLIGVELNGGKILELNHDTYTDVGGEPLRRERITPYFSRENTRLIVDAFEVEVDRGIGLVGSTPTVGVDPQLIIKAAKNGTNWGNERQVSCGKIGDHDARAITRAWGMGRNWRFSVAMADPVPYVLVDAYIRARPTGG